MSSCRRAWMVRPAVKRASSETASPQRRASARLIRRSTPFAPLQEPGDVVLASETDPAPAPRRSEPEAGEQPADARGSSIPRAGGPCPSLSMKPGSENQSCTMPTRCRSVAERRRDVAASDREAGGPRASMMTSRFSSRNGRLAGSAADREQSVSCLRNSSASVGLPIGAEEVAVELALEPTPLVLLLAARPRSGR